MSEETPEQYAFRIMDSLVEARKLAQAGASQEEILMLLAGVLVESSEKALGIKLDPGTFFIALVAKNALEAGDPGFIYNDKEKLRSLVADLRQAGGVTVININKEG